MIKYKLLHQYATEPSRATDGSAGFDLYATDNHHVWPGAQVKIPTGVSFAIPGDHAGFIWPRSGMAVKYGFDILAGLIDSDFLGEVMVAAINHGDKPIEIRRGDRIAQIVFSPVMTLMEMTDSIQRDSQRGAGAFGSSGV